MERFPLGSLRARLALWYLLVLGTVFVVFAAGTYVVVRKSLLDGVDAALQSRATTVLNQVGVGTQGIQYRSGDAPHANAEMAVHLFDRHGRLWHRVAGSEELPPLPAVLGPALHGRQSSTSVGTQRVYVAGLGGRPGRADGAIEVVQSLDGVQDTLRELLAVLVLAIPALLLAATAGGVFLAGRALAPIDRITRTAQQIEAQNLQGRLALGPRDDEVGRLAATFDGMLERLEHAFAQQRQFVADASHELRTPLAIMRSDLDILLRRPRSLHEHAAFEHELDAEIMRLSALMDDLLTLARADGGQGELEREFVFLDVLVAEAAEGLRRLAATKGVTVETRVERDVAVVGDPARLRQLVVNVLENAVKYTPTGGRVCVTVRPAGDDALVEIADTGIGIAPDDLPHIFDRFFRADQSRGRAEGGTGLGLPIARWCAEAHGGRIAVQSTLGQGSTFTIILPGVQTDEESPANAVGTGDRPTRTRISPPCALHRRLRGGLSPPSLSGRYRHPCHGLQSTVRLREERIVSACPV